MSPDELEQLLTVFKALADKNRLRLLGLLAVRDRSVEELSTLLGLGSPTVSHHLSKLKSVGLVGVRRAEDGQLYSLDDDALAQINKRVLGRPEMTSWVEDVEADAWERKVQRDFFRRGRLTEIPARAKKRRVVLKRLAQEFEPGRRYRQDEVNEVLQGFHPDFVALRRGLIDEGLLVRNSRGSIYLLQTDERV